MTHARSLLVVLLLVATAPPAPAQPGPTAEMSGERRKANALYKEGVRLFNAGQFADALELFADAYHRYPDPRILYSIATSLRQIGRTVDAANAYQRFIGDAFSEPQFVADSQTVLRVLDATVGKVDVSFEGPPGEVRAEDGEWLPPGTPSVRVAPGRFAIEARRDGFVADATGRITAGATVAVTLRWRSTTAPAPTPVPAPITPPALGGTTFTGDELGGAYPIEDRVVVERHRGRRVAAYTLGAGGLALVATALLLEHAAGAWIDDANLVCPSLRCSGDAYDVAQTSLGEARTRRLGATLAGGAAVAAIAGGVALWLTSRPTERRVRVAPIASTHGAGLAVEGSF